MQTNRTKSTPTDDQQQDAACEAGRAAIERGVIDALLDDERIRRVCEPTRAEEGIMALLLTDDHPGPWTRPEIEREVGHDTIATAEALVSLCKAGLLHMEGQLVIASRAARRMDEIGV